jgi:hypothetical protein
MYSVLRFAGHADKLEELGQAVNSLVPGLYNGPDRRGGRFSCAISEGDTWEQHSDAIQRVLEQLTPAIKAGLSVGFIIQIDVAIEPEDYNERWITELSLSSDMVRVLGEHRIRLNISIYGQGEAELGTKCGEY